jgi:hypothetical protein
MGRPVTLPNWALGYLKRHAIAPEPLHLNAPQDKLQIGARAEALLHDPILALAFEKLERDIDNRWRNSAVGEKEQREAAYRMHWAIEQVRVKLRTMLGDAQMMRAEHERKEGERRREAERKERFGY